MLGKTKKAGDTTSKKPQGLGKPKKRVTQFQKVTSLGKTKKKQVTQLQ